MSTSDEERDKLREEDPDEYFSQMHDEFGRDHLVAMNDPYNPEPGLSEYLASTDSSCTNEELGLDANGEREDA